MTRLAWPSTLIAATLVVGVGLLCGLPGGELSPAHAQTASKKTSEKSSGQSQTKAAATAKSKPVSQSSAPSKSTSAAAKGATSPASKAKTKAATPTPFLIGDYDIGYYEISCSESDHKPIRVFAARITQEILPADNVKKAMDAEAEKPETGRRASGEVEAELIFRRIQENAERAARAIAWNRICVAPQGIVSRRMILDSESLVVGARCPICKQIHWVAIGMRSNERKSYEVWTNNSTKANDNSDTKGWKEVKFPQAKDSGLPENASLRYALLEEGGYDLETFSCRAPAKAQDLPAALPDACECDIQLMAGLTDEGDFAFGFRMAGVTNVRMVGDYINKLGEGPDGRRARQSIQIQHFAAVVSRGSGVRVSSAPRKLPELAREAAKFASETVQLNGKTLADITTMKRQRLTTDQLMILGTFNASQYESRWLAIGFAEEMRDGKPALIPIAYSETATGVQPIPYVPSILWQTGGVTVEIKTDAQNGDVDYHFLGSR
jgi:hypothetical protein